MSWRDDECRAYYGAQHDAADARADARRDAEADAADEQRKDFIRTRAAELAKDPDEVSAILCDAFLASTRSLDPVRAAKARALASLLLSGDTDEEFVEKLRDHIDARCVELAGDEFDAQGWNS